MMNKLEPNQACDPCPRSVKDPIHANSFAREVRARVATGLISDHIHVYRQKETRKGREKERARERPAIDSDSTDAVMTTCIHNPGQIKHIVSRCVFVSRYFRKALANTTVNSAPIQARLAVQIGDSR